MLTISDPCTTRIAGGRSSPAMNQGPNPSLLDQCHSAMANRTQSVGVSNGRWVVDTPLDSERGQQSIIVLLSDMTHSYSLLAIDNGFQSSFCYCSAIP